ncbi:MAG: YkvA family protein [Candidatus Rokuibacteriota bacterium]
MRFGALRELLWLLPHLAGLIARLLNDARVPRRVKVVLGLAAVYLASPVDIVPDFVPFLGYLDDVILVAVILDGLLNHVDRQILLEHWPGDPASLDRSGGIAARLAGWVPRRFKARVFGAQSG